MSTITLPTRWYRRFPAEDPLGYSEEALDVDLRRSAFLAVDVNGAGSDILLQCVAPAMDAARRVGLPVIYAGNSAPRAALERYEFTVQRDRNAQHYFPEVIAEPEVDPREYHHGHGPWSGYHPSVAPQPGDHYVRKIAYSGFYETRMDSLLRHLGVETLISVGFSASECLLGTLLEAFNRNYRVILLRDCTHASEQAPEAQFPGAFTARMVLWMETYLGRSATSQDFIAACEQASLS